MELIKKNIGLIIGGVISLALCVFIGIRMGSALGRASDSRKKVEEQRTFFAGVKQENILLDSENVRIAGDNQAIAEKKFLELRRALAAKSQIDPLAPASAYQCVQQLQPALTTLSRKCAEAGIMVAPQYKYFSFEEIALNPKLPDENDVVKIFRHLRIVQEVVRLLVEAEISTLAKLDRSMKLEVLEEDLYTVTPLQINISGEAGHIQKFVNLMTTGSAYFFFLKKISLLSVDQAPGGELAGLTGTASTARTLPGMGGMDMGGMEDMGGGGMEDMGGMAVGGMAVGGMAVGGMDMGGTGGGIARGVQPDMSEMALSRQQLIAFESRRQVSANLRFDLVEFLLPAQQE